MLLPLLVAVAAVPARSPATDGGTLLFSSDRATGFDLFAVPAAGGGAELVVGGAGDDHEPAWSADGRRLVFAHVTEGGRRSAVFLAEEGGVRRLTFGRIDRQPAWSPDGTRLAFVRSFPAEGRSRIQVLVVETGRLRKVTDPGPGTLDASPSWSPDGTRIAFSRARLGAPPDLYSVRADGSGLRRLTRTDALETAPDWSPDGTRIAFERCCPDGSSDLYAMAASGGEEANLTASPAHESSPAWSPDGSRIAFVLAPAAGGARDLVTIDAAGSDRRLVTSHVRADLSPAWLPPGVEPPDVGSSVARTARSPSRAAPAGAPRRVVRGGRRIAKGVRLVRVARRRVPQRVYALLVDPRRGHAIDAALAGGRLAGTRRTRAIVRANRGLAGINGDFALPSGSPVHAFQADGDLKKTTPTAGVHFAVSRDQRRLFLGWRAPGLRLLETSTGDRVPIARWNDGAPVVGEAAGYTAAGQGLMRAPAGACAVRLASAGPLGWTEDGSLQRPYAVERAGCFASSLGRRGGVVLAAPAGTAEAVLLRSMRRGDVARLSWGYGWPRVFDGIGGTPLLVEDGRIVARPCGSSFCARHPRTAVGITRRGKVVLVVVDGRRRRWSRGMTLVQLARQMRRLGAAWAVNLDGGGSSTMVVRGRVVNRPSDRTGERAVSSALLVLRGKDREPVPEEPATLARRSPPAALRDPASTGGLREALRERAFADWGR